MNKSSSKNLLVMVILTAIIFFTYLPTIMTDYLYHDDYFLLLVNNITKCQNHPQFADYIINTVRPLGIIIKCFNGSIVNDIASGVFARSVSLIFLIIFSTLIYFNLVYHRINFIVSASISLLIITLPPYQISIAMLANSTSIYGSIISFLTGWLITYYLSKRGYDNTLLSLKEILLSSLLLTISLMIYQPSAFIYFLPIMIYLFKQNQPILKKMNISFFTILPVFIASISYIILRNIIQFYLGDFIKNFYAGSEISIDPINKISWVINDLFPFALSFWFINSKSSLIQIITILCLTIIFIYLLNLKFTSYKEQNSLFLFKNKIFNVTYFIGALFVSISPFLIIESNNILYRTNVSFQSCLLFGLLLMLISNFEKVSKIIKNFFNLCLIFVTSISVIIAQNNVYLGYTLPQSIEISFIKEKLKQLNNQEDKFLNLHYIRTINPFTLTHQDEFANFTSSFPQDVQLLHLGILKELNKNNYNINDKKIITIQNELSYDFLDIWSLEGTTKKLPKNVYIKNYYKELNKNNYNIKFKKITTGLNKFSYDFPDIWPLDGTIKELPKNVNLINLNEIHNFGELQAYKKLKTSYFISAFIESKLNRIF